MITAIKSDAGMPYTMKTWHELIEAIHSGEVFEVDSEAWDYWLEVLPPVYMGREQLIKGEKIKCSFGFAEGREQITDFWRERSEAGDEDGFRYFGCRSNRINHWG